MRNVIVTKLARQRILGLESYLLNELMLSEFATYKYSGRMKAFIQSLGGFAGYALCRFKEWRARGWRCAVFEKD